jgi:hypothetical protein
MRKWDNRRERFFLEYVNKSFQITHYTLFLLYVNFKELLNKFKDAEEPLPSLLMTSWLWETTTIKMHMNNSVTTSATTSCLLYMVKRSIKSSSTRWGLPKELQLVMRHLPACYLRMHGMHGVFKQLEWSSSWAQIYDGWKCLAPNGLGLETCSTQRRWLNTTEQPVNTQCLNYFTWLQ